MADLTISIDHAVAHLINGGVIAYPTEHCFGLGCDPLNEAAVRRILTIKQRRMAQGLILIAASSNQVEEYARLQEAPLAETVENTWPGPNTWLLPKQTTTPAWLTGEHQSIAMRVTAHPFSQRMCQQFGGAIVSTSANRHGRSALLTAKQVQQELGDELDYIVAADVGGDSHPSIIRDATTGEQLR